MMTNLARSLAQHAEDTFEIADAVIVDLADRASRTIGVRRATSLCGTF